MRPDPTSPATAADPLRAAQQPLLRGDFSAAAALIEPLLAVNPRDFRGWGLLGRCRRLLGQLSDAEAALQRSLALVPSFPAARRELALLRAAQGRRPEALQQLAALCDEMPADGSLWWERALLEAPEAPERALQSVLRLRALRPEDPEPALLQVQLLTGLGRIADARDAIDALLAARPAWADAVEAAYWVDVAAGNPHRLQRARHLVGLAPTPGRWLRLGQEELLAGDSTAAHVAFDAALALEPGFLPARWAVLQTPPTLAPADDAAIERFAARWSEGLAWFEALPPDDPSLLCYGADCATQSTAFYRHYLGDDVIVGQRRLGDVLQRLVGTHALPSPHRALRARSRRIAVVSAHLREHTVARLFAPLIEALATEGFELHLFAVAPVSTGWRSRLDPVATRHDGPRSLAGWRDAIASVEPDVVLYPEIGMDAMTQALAALRLAPVQAALWGHPVTTGLSSIDWFLSPDAMEPPDAQSSYSEKLLRLPGLGHGLRPDDLPTPRCAALPGSGPGTVDLLCAQTLYKLLPAQDRLFARILAARPEARLHLLADDRPAVQDWLRARMAATFEAHGADPDRQLLIHGFMPLSEFLGLADACVLNLDSIGWSGGMSSIDLLAQGMPTLTLPGATMRSRQAAALLRHLGVDALVAADADAYVDTAVDLIDRPPRVAAFRESLLARRDRLFDGRSTADALARFLRDVQAP
jgi:protein O-GlcNAc transferase